MTNTRLPSDKSGHANPRAVDELPGNETVVAVPAPEHRFSLLCNAEGAFLTGAEGQQTHVDDEALWEQEGSDFIHVCSGAKIAGSDARIQQVMRGPHQRPSALLDDFRRQGWVCLPALLDPELIRAIEQVACVGTWSEQRYDRSLTPLLQDAAVARIAVEPVSLWLMRQYMSTNAIRLAHSPSLAVLGQDDGERDVQGWHSDFPYLWGITRKVGGNRVPTQVSGDLVLGVQRNICISAFSSEFGATAFKLGSHTRNEGPPESWGIGADYSTPGYRAEHGLPYGGVDAQVIEAPAGSIILYDARTWHRQGVNRLQAKRAAMLQAVTPMWVMPFSDTSADYRAFKQSHLAQGLNPRESAELEEILLHRVVGPAGSYVIGPQADL
ncbi:MAG: hypothetical protein AAF513_10705 [Pseudomonadota bacterium]